MSDQSRQVVNRLFECEDCHERRFVRFIELNRASKPRCFKCGSTKLELVSDDAKDDRARLNAERLSGTEWAVSLSCVRRNRHRAIR